jgi:hypothetical protein
MHMHQNKRKLTLAAISQRHPSVYMNIIDGSRTCDAQPQLRTAANLGQVLLASVPPLPFPLRPAILEGKNAQSEHV